MKLDEFDIKILNALQDDNRITSAELAEAANLSSSACLRRIQRLRDEGVISREVAVLDPTKIDRPLTVLVLISVDADQTARSEIFVRDIAECDLVSHFHYIAGEFDYALIVNATTMQEYNRFTDRYFHANPFVKKFQSLFSLKAIKSSTALSLDHLR